MRVGKDRIIVERSPAPETTSGGLKIPDMSKETPDYGVVIVVGSDVTDWKVGDTVVYPKWAGFLTKFPNDERDLLVLMDSDVWASL